MSLLRRIEKAVDHRLRALFAGGGDEPGAREGIELYRDALEQIAGRTMPGKSGSRVFPFNTVTIELRAEDTERKAMLETLFEPRQFLDDIRSTLNEDRVSAPEDLAVMVHYPENPAIALRVICGKTEKPEAPAVVPAAVLVFQIKPAKLTVLSGAASEVDFTLSAPQVNLGREEEVVDSLGHLIRRNELFFPESGHEANASVSRVHAHIAFDSTTGDWRIFDDGSSFGTSLFRKGKRIEIPAHASRGVALRDEDEIYLGQARLKFTS